MSKTEKFTVEFEGVDTGLAAQAKAADAALDSLSSSAKAAAGAVGGVGDAAGESGKLFKDANGRWRDANGKFVKMGEGASGASGKLKGLGSTMLGVELAMKAFDVAAQAAQATIGALAGEVAGAINKTLEFETAITQSAAATGGSIEQRLANQAKMSKIAMEAAATSKFSALEAAQGLDHLARAGYTVEQMQTTLSPALNFATGNVLELSDAMSQAVTAKAAFSSTAEALPELLDKISKGATLAKTDVSQLGDAASRSAGSLKVLGNSDSDIIALNAALIEKTNSAELAGTALRGLATRLTEIGENTKAGAAFKKLGIEIKDAKGEVRPFIDIVDQFNKATANVDPVDKLKLASKAFGKEYAKNIIQLGEVGAEKLRSMSDEISNATGETERMARMMQATAEGQLAIMEGKIDTLRTELGGALQPAIMAVVGGLGSLADHLSQSPALFNALVTAGQGWVATASDLVPVGSAGAQIFIWMAEQAAVLGLQIQGLKLDFESLYRDLTTEEQTKLDSLNTEVFRTREEFEELRWKVEHVADDMEVQLDRAVKSMERFKKSAKVETDDELLSGYNADAFTDEQIAKMKASGDAFKIQLAERLEWQKGYAERAKAIQEDLSSWQSEADKPKDKKRLGAGDDSAAKAAARKAEREAEAERKRLAKEFLADQEKAAKSEVALMRASALRADISKETAAYINYEASLRAAAYNTQATEGERQLAQMQAEKQLREDLAKIAKDDAEAQKKAAKEKAKAEKSAADAARRAAKKAAEAQKKAQKDIANAISLANTALSEGAEIAMMVAEAQNASDRQISYIKGGVQLGEAAASAAEGFGTGNPMAFVAAGKHLYAANTFFKAAGKGSAGGAGGGSAGAGGSSASSSTSNQWQREQLSRERQIERDKDRKATADAITEALLDERNARQNASLMINLNSPTVLGTPEGARQFVKTLGPELRRVITEGRRP